MERDFQESRYLYEEACENRRVVLERQGTGGNYIVWVMFDY